MEHIYIDSRIDAGEWAPGGFEPDFSFFADEGFRCLTDDERTILKTYDMSTLFQEQFVVGFGGKHSKDPRSELCVKTGESVDHFMKVINGETDRAVGILEGGIRYIDLTLHDEQIFASFSEVGKAQALLQRAGVEVVEAEPLTGLDALVKKYGDFAVLHYLGLRILPQWYLLDQSKRPAPNEYIVSIFRTRPYLSRIRHITGIDSYVRELTSVTPFTLPYGIPMPDREECLRQTTHEYVVNVPAGERTITQQITLDHNIQRDRRLYSDITRYLGHGMHIFFVYGDVHVRALDKRLHLDAKIMHFSRKTAHRPIKFPPSS